MSKGTIISGGTAGEYTVRIDWDLDRLNAAITRLDSRISWYAAYLATLAPGKAYSLAALEKTALERHRAYVQSLIDAKTDDSRTAWCADYTENLSGEVGMIEIPGEDTYFNIQPGYDGNAVYSATRDGQLETAAAGTPAGVYWNLALMPCWQKYMPTFRYGTITAIDGDTCDVTLDGATSSQQAMDVNQSTTLSGVSIEYMSCNGAAFEVDDEVIVKFTGQDWASPKVVGFKSHPVPCDLWKFKLTRGDGVLVDESLNPVFRIYKSDGNQITGGHTATYDDDPGSDDYQYWTVTLDDYATDDDPSGYWVEYQCDDANLWVQYPEKYISSDQRQAADLIEPDAVKRTDYCHFYYEGADVDWAGYESPASIPRPIVWGDYSEDALLYPEPTEFGLCFKRGASITKGQMIKSSVPVYCKCEVNACDMSVLPDGWPPDCPVVPLNFDAWYDTGWERDRDGIESITHCPDIGSYVVPSGGSDPLFHDVITELYFDSEMGWYRNPYIARNATATVGSAEVGAIMTVSVGSTEHEYTSHSSVSTITAEVGTSAAGYTQLGISLTCDSEASGYFYHGDEDCLFEHDCTYGFSGVTYHGTFLDYVELIEGSHNYTYARPDEIVDSIDFHYDPSFPA